MNTHVNFEIAKLLREKGFEGIKSPLWYYKDGTIHESHVEYFRGLKCWNTWEATQGVRWDAPTIAEVVMWLYEKHGIWIDVCTNQFSKPKHLEWMYSIIFTERCTYSYSPKSYTSPTKAYEAAILYILNKLI